MSVSTMKLLSVFHTREERIKVDGQETVLLMKEDFGVCTLTHGVKRTADWASQNREIDLTRTELHIMWNCDKCLKYTDGQVTEK